MASMPCHAMPYHTMPYHTIPYHTHTIQRHTQLNAVRLWWQVGQVAYDNSINNTVTGPRAVGNAWFTRIPATPLGPESDLSQKYFSALYW